MNEQNGDIEIPAIEIAPGFTVDDIDTIDDCDDAFSLLTAAVVGIEFRLDELESLDQKSTPSYRRTKSALRYKKAGLNIVQAKRGKINRADMSAQKAENIASAKTKDRATIKLFKIMFPDEYSQVWRQREINELTEAKGE